MRPGPQEGLFHVFPRFLPHRPHRPGARFGHLRERLGTLARPTGCADAPRDRPTYFGTKVVDNYRYMEDLGDAEVKAWMKAQADYTRARLDAIPGARRCSIEFTRCSNADLLRGGFVRRGDRYFYEVFEPARTAQALLPRRIEGRGTPTARSGRRSAPGHRPHYALDYFEPSWGGRFVAYGVSEGGSEESVIHVVDVKTGSAARSRSTAPTTASSAGGPTTASSSTCATPSLPRTRRRQRSTIPGPVLPP